MAYDPEAEPDLRRHRQRHALAAGRPAGQETEHLDNLYVASILAIDADTGELKWHFQCTSRAISGTSTPCST